MGKQRIMRWSFVALAALAVFVAVACNDDKDDDQAQSTAAPTSSGTAAPAGDVLTREQILTKDGSATKQEELDWGWMFEQTGPLAGFGVPAGDGAKLAVKEINDAGGFQVGDTVYTVNLLEHDTKSDVSETIAVTTQLIQDDDVKVILGPAAVGDPESTQLSQQAQVLHLCPCPQRELTTLTDADAAAGDYHWAFQGIAAPSKFLPPGAKNTKEVHPEFTTFATMCAASAPGETFCKNFKDAYSAAGFEFVGEESFPPQTTDFSPFLTNLRSKDPDLILNFVDAGPEQFTLLRQSCELDVGKFYISVALPYELWNSLVNCPSIRDKYVSSGAAPRTEAIYTSDDARDFFENRYKPYNNGSLPPAAFAAMLTYDPVYMLIAAMQQAGSVDDTTKIADALETVHFHGAGEEDMYFNSQNIMVTGNDSCPIYQEQMTCSHFPPPPQE